VKAVTESGKEYPSWEALVEGESNGYVAVALLRERAPKETVFPWVVGPFPTQALAQNAARRMRASFRRQDRDFVVSDLVSTRVRPAWKDVR
jgi:hypothetical protein